MSKNMWDNTGIQPDLMKLPLHIREGMTQHIPHRPDECNAAFMIFRQTPGLNHPNARCNVTTFRKEANSAISINGGAQVDFTDFSGRLALATAVIDQSNLGSVIASLIRVYTGMGGDIHPVLDAANVVRLKEEKVAFFEERNDE